MDFAAKFSEGLSYSAFLDKYGSPDQKRRWADFFNCVSLSEAQKALLGSFKRQMKVIVMAGTWCGDCVNQCPMFEHFALACPLIDIRYFDRTRTRISQLPCRPAEPLVSRRSCSSAKMDMSAVVTGTARCPSTAASSAPPPGPAARPESRSVTT